MREEEEVVTLDSLEERVLRAVDLVGKLRKERDALARRLEDAAAEKDAAVSAAAEAKSEAAQAKSEAVRLQQELDSLRGDRKQVRTRIEKLLGQMELLGDQ